MEGRITLLFSRDGASLEIKDEKSNAVFVRGSLTAEQVMRLMSREAHVNFEFEVYGLDKVGKQMHQDTLTFPMPEDYDWTNRKEVACELALQHCPEGWTPDNYFGSQDSFYIDEDGKQHARVTIRKWVSEDKDN